MLPQDSNHAVLREGLGQDVVHTYKRLTKSTRQPPSRDDDLTELEIRSNVLLPDVGCHGNNGCLRRHNPNAGRGRDTVEHGHDDVHEDEIVPHRLLVYLVNSFRAVMLVDMCQQMVIEAGALRIY